MRRRPKIAIISGGIAGSAALAVFRRGIEVAVYEQAGELSETGIVRLDARVVAVEPGGPDARLATARFADGSEIEADIVVGADGIHSTVRHQLFGADQPRFTGCMCWRGYDATRGALPDARATLYLTYPLGAPILDSKEMADVRSGRASIPQRSSRLRLRRSAYLAERPCLPALRRGGQERPIDG